MPQLTQIKETKKGRMALFFDGEFAFSLDADTFAKVLQRKPRRKEIAPGFYFGIGIQAAAALHPKATISCDLPTAATNRHCTWVPGAKQNRKHPSAAEPNAGRKDHAGAEKATRPAGRCRS